MWHGNSNKVMALKKCFSANVIIFLTARKTLHRNVTRAQLQSVGENLQGKAHSRVHHMWAESKGHEFIQFVLTLVLREQ